VADEVFTMIPWEMLYRAGSLLLLGAIGWGIVQYRTHDPDRLPARATRAPDRAQRR
jgi:hypothetical protein